MRWRPRRRAYLEGKLQAARGALLASGFFRAGDFARAPDEIAPRIGRLVAHYREVLRGEAEHVRQLEERLVFCLRHHGGGTAGRRTLYNPEPAVVDADGYRRYAEHLDARAPGWQYDDRDRMAPGLAVEAVRRLTAVAALTGVPMIVADVAEEGR